MQICSFARSHFAIPLLPFIFMVIPAKRVRGFEFPWNFHNCESRGAICCRAGSNWSVMWACAINLNKLPVETESRYQLGSWEIFEGFLRIRTGMARLKYRHSNARHRRSFLTSSLADPLLCAVIDVPRYFLRTTSTGRHVGDFFVQ